MLGRWIPPIIGALLMGAAVVAMSGRFQPGPAVGGWVAEPVLQSPEWSAQAMIELVVPLAITVLVVQNGQGIAVLRAAGHVRADQRHHHRVRCLVAVGGGVGAVSTCLTGPTNALLAASGERSRHYAAGIFCGLLAIIFGIFAPLFTRLMLSTPAAFVAVLAGLAMLRVLQAAFVTAFRTHFSLGALVTFIVTVADINVLNIGAAFWGLRRRPPCLAAARTTRISPRRQAEPRLWSARVVRGSVDRKTARGCPTDSNSG